MICSITSGCGNDRACAIDDDCFSGEYCSDEQCVVGTRPNASPNAVADAGGQDVTSSDTPSSGDGDADDISSADMPNSGDSGVICLVDPFGNTCADDEFEENDLYTQQLPIPIGQDSWCQDGVLVASSQSFEGRLCPGDRADLFRIQIDNRTPHQCLSDQFTIRTTVELAEPCDASDVIRIFPYLSFDNPNLNGPCGQNEDLRCMVSDDQRTHTFDWVRQTEQLVDQRLIIEPRQDDVQVDYTVTVEIIQ